MTESPPTDRDLLTQHTTGDRDAFGELVRRHRDRMWRVALRTLHATTYPPDSCPLCAEGQPVVKPGSRPVARVH